MGALSPQGAGFGGAQYVERQAQIPPGFLENLFGTSWLWIPFWCLIQFLRAPMGQHGALKPCILRRYYLVAQAVPLAPSQAESSG